MAGALKILVPQTKVLISTAVDHYTKGPPQPSWDLRFHLTFSVLKSLCAGCIYQTIENAQQLSCMSPPSLPAGFIEDRVVISNEYRRRAQPYLEKILSEYEHVLDDEWKELEDEKEVERDNEKEDVVGNRKWLSAKWIYSKEQGFKRMMNNKRVILYLHGGAYFMCSADSHRVITAKIAGEADALVFAVNYRLAPQHQFPAAVHDALAAYLYLTNPPEDAGFEAIDPKQIVIMGDSAGGGLAIALGLLIRDIGMPSVLSPLSDNTDYLPSSGFVYRPSPVLDDFHRKSEALSKRIKKENRPQFWDSSLNREERVQLYAPNEALTVSYVSPMCAESLAGLPPMLIQTGDGEKIRDEIIYFSFKASQPEKYNLPSYNAEKFKRSQFKTPTNVTLEVYQDMPHVFQLFDFNASAKVAFKHSGEFIKKVINTTKDQTSSLSNDFTPLLNPNESTYSLITTTGEAVPLKEKHYSVLEWPEVGKAPAVVKSKPTTTNQ
ncbi:9128_t:CDS:2 [Acaulospora morrowiae]|uniref:9128_t:CDS:1 n=1 Tax=Acaulospora morrowiae TaxID=94023 RepID=A0A9N9B3B4_9GLOM|nr:9128_t:CDS:2 [Acaulospora morrowiae]